MKFTLLFYLFLNVQLILTFQLYCKCECNLKAIINSIDQCKLCTKEYCLKQDPKLCNISSNNDNNNKLKGQNDNSDNNDNNNNNGSDDDDKDDNKQDIIISCFQIESIKDSFIIYSFLIIIGLLMLFILYKSYTYT
ncbi:unnamed protein product [Candida verbasci]|uniref:Uncharacterized protein n=1 Tax=Candida verbasci TaxID=1227364 RepID=A0A9W4TWU7_9ASCO|nr:unnamed protein product [Candida verbasci]